MKISAIIPAAGTGSRYSADKNKLFENIIDVPVIIRTLQAISSVDGINDITICSHPDLITEIEQIIAEYNILKVKQVIQGGKTRQESRF
ncbi:MAG: 2-C-methyl-D-erythritol 4-phosphate cytidylyltransferase [Candidatus Moduliflexus flocculans]|nr:2-C-methyl-D-erythritol 4-phosphate cytidylyltransferase [Candidatus Moduliflexus flocculans]